MNIIVSQLSVSLRYAVFGVEKDQFPFDYKSHEILWYNAQCRQTEQGILILILNLILMYNHQRVYPITTDVQMCMRLYWKYNYRASIKFKKKKEIASAFLKRWHMTAFLKASADCFSMTLFEVAVFDCTCNKTVLVCVCFSTNLSMNEFRS